MFIIRAPYPYIATTTLLPSPVWSDSVSLAGTVSRMRTMDGTLYTYVTSRQGRKAFQWSFEVARNKAIELIEFFNAYFSQALQITDHNGDVWVGYIKNNPFELSGAGRAFGWPGNETMQFTIEFEEK